MSLIFYHVISQITVSVHRVTQAISISVHDMLKIDSQLIIIVIRYRNNRLFTQKYLDTILASISPAQGGTP